MKNKLMIVPGVIPKLSIFATRVVTRKMAMKLAYNITERKLYKDKK